MPVSRRHLLATAAAVTTSGLAGCSVSLSDERWTESEHIETVSTERRGNPRVVDLVVQLTEDHGATAFAVVDGVDRTVFQTSLRADQTVVRVPLENGVDAILQPISTLPTLDHELVVFDGETELSRQSWRPAIELEYSFELANEPDVDIANSLRIRISNSSDMRLQPLRAAIVSGFPTELHETDRVGSLSSTEPAWAVGGQTTTRLLADHPNLGSNLLAPPEGECVTEPQSIELEIAYEQVVDRISLAVSLGGEPRPYTAADGTSSVYCSQPTIDDWELTDRDLLL